MSEVKEAEAPPEKKGAAPKKAKGPGLVARLLAWPRSITTAGCAASLTALFLVCLLVVAWVWFYFDPANIPWRHAMGWRRILVEIALVIVIPIVLYRAIKLWLEGDKSTYPDIDFAWQAGVDALSQNGLSLASAPLFLVLGSSSVRQEQSLIRAAGIGLRVHDTPDGPAPLHWFAGPDGIYLFLSETCGGSALSALLEKRAREGGAGDSITAPATMRSLPAVSPVKAAAAPARPAPTSGGGGTRGTIMLDQFVADVQAQTAQTQADQDQGETERDADMFTSPAAAASDQPAVLSQQEMARQLKRLEYVCYLLRRARFPMCPVNGMLTLLPFEIFQATSRETQQLTRTVRADLDCIQREMSIRCPVTALVVGMHQERGFRELVRRVGRERASTQRFGRRFDVRMIPAAEPMGALCAQLSGVFEDWIHTLFREAEALSRPGNLRLYSLLCRVRSTLTGVLNEVLVGGFGHDPQSKELAEPVPFSGCYFAATGESDDQQAFVRGVFEKLIEEQEDVEWTRRAVANNRRFTLIAAASLAAAGCVAIAMVSVVIYRLVT
jgi:hypothetical protein